MASPDDFSPSAFAGEMQDRTRKQQGFDDIEAKLPDPKSPAMLLDVDGVLSHLGHLNPFVKTVEEGDIVWLFDNTAYKHHLGSSWHAEFIVAVFESDPKCRVADVVAGIANTLGLAEGAAERKTIEKRLMPFIWELRAARTVTVTHQAMDLQLGPTNVNGISQDTPVVQSSDGGTAVKSTAQVPANVSGLLDMKTHYASSHGWGIISDIDDTIKVTMTSDPVGILRSTFVSDPVPIKGMPQLYGAIKSLLSEDTPWFYLSASPYNLYPFLRDFRDQHYPHGTMILRDASWKTVSGLLSNLTLGTEEYKSDRMKKINSWLPKRKMICFGDTTQSDPEAYGDIYRKFDGWIKLILIRKATDIAEIGISDKNKPERFEKAFKGVPADAWHVFEDPAECVQIIRDVIAKEGR